MCARENKKQNMTNALDAMSDWAEIKQKTKSWFQNRRTSTNSGVSTSRQPNDNFMAISCLLHLIALPGSNRMLTKPLAPFCQEHQGRAFRSCSPFNDYRSCFQLSAINWKAVYRAWTCPVSAPPHYSLQIRHMTKKQQLHKHDLKVAKKQKCRSWYFKRTTNLF